MLRRFSEPPVTTLSPRATFSPSVVAYVVFIAATLLVLGVTFSKF